MFRIFAGPNIILAFLLTVSISIAANCQPSDSIILLTGQHSGNGDADEFERLCLLASGSINSDSIIKFSELAIELAQRSGINPAQAYVFKGFGYLNAGKLAPALKCFIEAAEFYKADHNTAGTAATYTYIAETYIQQENYENAKTYLTSAAEIFRKENDTVSLASTLHNLGYADYSMGKYDTALVLYSETSEIYLKLGFLTEYAFCLGNTGLVYLKLSDYKKAEDYLLKSIDILTSQREIRALTQYMTEYAGILQNKGELGKAKDYATRSFIAASKNRLIELERDAAYRLSRIYEALGRYDSAFHYQSVYINKNDSIKNIKVIQRMADLRTEFEVAKKQAEVDVLEKNKLLQLIVIVGLGLILLMAIGIILIYYSSLKKSKKFLAILDERNTLLENQSRELKEQREELQQQKEEIISSINYAKYIQSSILPENELLESLLREHFVLYKPKDIVSGDFYWISNIENKTVLAAADCTGHGVPGAFMSMLGTALLNEIVNKEYLTHPGVILRHLRKEVISSLQQKGGRGGQKDGMDIALCTLDLDNMKLQFAGANSPLYLIRKSTLEKVGIMRCEMEGDYLLYEIKGDLMPIGISDRMDNFTFHEFDIFKGDTFVLFSDGLPDQFGGPSNRKFGYRNFRELLLRYNSSPMAEIKVRLEEGINEWMGKESQIDDIMVIGFRIG